MLTYTPEELMAKVDPVLACSSCRSLVGNKDAQRDWLGATAEEIQEWAITGWAGGVAKLLSLPGLDAPDNQSGWTREWSDSDGDYWDMDRYYDERPFLSRRVRKAKGNRKGSQVSLLINVIEPAYRNSDAMLWKAYAAVKAVDELEAQGKRVTVSVGWHTICPVPQMDKIEERVRVKEPEDPITLTRLAYWTAPWALRFWLMGRVRKDHPNFNRGMGTCRRLTRNEDDGKCLTIETGECLSEAGAKKWLGDIGRKDG